jgi:hypothetical protein
MGTRGHLLTIEMATGTYYIDTIGKAIFVPALTSIHTLVRYSFVSKYLSSLTFFTTLTIHLIKKIMQVSSFFYVLYFKFNLSGYIFAIFCF